MVDESNLEAVVEAAPPNSAPVWPPEQFVRAPGVFWEQPEAKSCFKTEMPLSACPFSEVTSSYCYMVPSI